MTPAEHRDAAVQHLACINDIGIEPSEAVVLTQAAIAHALLGLLEVQLQNYGAQTPPSGHWCKNFRGETWWHEDSRPPAPGKEAR